MGAPIHVSNRSLAAAALQKPQVAREASVLAWLLLDYKRDSDLRALRAARSHTGGSGRGPAGARLFQVWSFGSRYFERLARHRNSGRSKDKEWRRDGVSSLHVQHPAARRGARATRDARRPQPPPPRATGPHRRQAWRQGAQRPPSAQAPAEIVPPLPLPSALPMTRLNAMLNASLPLCPFKKVNPYRRSLYSRFENTSQAWTRALRPPPG